MLLQRGAGVAAAVIAVSGCGADPELGSTSSAIVDPSLFVLPSLSAEARARIVHNYDALDPNDTIPRALLEDTIVYFETNKDLIPNPDYFVVVDFTRYSGRDRFWLVDLATGAVEPHKVAHGSGSDPDNNGYATIFSNEPGSYQSSLGFYLTGEIYDGTHPHSMRLDGLSPDGSPNGMANTNVRDRLIVVHEASYVDDSNTSQQGRRNGCFALDPSIEVSVVDRIHDGSLMYADTKPLNTPVGRASCGDAVCDASESADSCPADCDSAADDPGHDPVDDPGEGGGCSAGHGSAWLLLALLGVRRRRR
jgi:hypothetical protein